MNQETDPSDDNSEPSECCGTCHFWDRDNGKNGQAACRRFPSPIPKASVEWCGEYKTLKAEIHQNVLNSEELHRAKKQIDDYGWEMVGTGKYRMPLGGVLDVNTGEITYEPT